ncbi:MAG TPA: hypothetical protein VGD24_04505 [Gallionella sp.]
MPFTAQVRTNFDVDIGIGSAPAIPFVCGVSFPVEMGTFELRRAHYFSQLRGGAEPTGLSNMAGKTAASESPA